VRVNFRGPWRKPSSISSGSSADPTTPAASTPDLGRGGSGDANDIEQFTAWLEGLKKK